MLTYREFRQKVCVYVCVWILCTIFTLFCKPEIMSKYKAKRKILYNTENQTFHKSKNQRWTIIQPLKMIKHNFFAI